MRIERATLFPIHLVFRERFRSARGVAHGRRGTLIELRSSSGLVGWGEASCFPGFGEDRVEAVRAELARVAGAIVGREIESPSTSLESLCGLADLGASVCAAVETALLDITAQERASSVAELLAGDRGFPMPLVASSVPCNALIAGESVADIEREFRSLAPLGFGVWKLKVGSLALEADVARVAALRSVVGRDAGLRLDANQAYSEPQAHEALERFAAHDIDYIEEPLAAADPTRMAELRRKSPIAIAADESAVTENDTRLVIEAGAADVIVIKPSAAGGPGAALRVATLARQAGLRIVVTSLLESAVGVSAALHAAAAIAADGPLEACGLATSDRFERNVCAFDPVARGVLRIASGSGLGLTIDRTGLATLLDGPAVEFHP